MADVEKAIDFQWMKKQKLLLSPEEREKGTGMGRKNDPLVKLPHLLQDCRQLPGSLRHSCGVSAQFTE